MTIWEAVEKLDKKGIKYTIYDCYAGDNDKEFTIFNAYVLVPQNNMNLAIYASNKSNWQVLNKEGSRQLKRIFSYQF